MLRRLFFPSLGFFFILIVATSLFTVHQVYGLQWQDEDSVIIQAARDDAKVSNSITRHKRQFGAGFPFGPNGFPQLPGFPSSGGFPGFPGFPGGFPQFLPTIKPIQPVQQPVQPQPVQVQPKPVQPAGSCLTRMGEQGYCATLRQCYPVLYSSTEGDYNADGDEHIRNPGLAEQLRDVSGPCDSYKFYAIFMFRADAEARQKLVCCSSHNEPPQAIDNPNQTMRPPWARPPATEATTTTTTQQPRTTTNRPWDSPIVWTHPTHPPLPTHPPDHSAATHPPFIQQQTHRPPTTQSPQTTKRPPQQFPPWGVHPAVSTTQSPAPRPPTTTTTHAPAIHPQPVPSSCGHTKVVGGQQATKGEFPWLVSLMSSGKQFCGGSLIDSQYILTAAHCVQHMTEYHVKQMRVHIGDYDIYSNSDGPVTIKSVSTLIRHRGFSHHTLHNDIALLKLDSPVQFGSNGNNNIAPICLNTNGGYDSGNHRATVAGWGSVYENGPQPSTYRKVEMRIWTNDECRGKYGHNAPGGITSHMVCAGSPNADACRGDSGGPLASNAGGRWTQIGIVSWGIGCGRYPGVYSRVDQFSPWISKNRQH